MEKYIKACLVLSRVGFRKTHNIGELAALLPEDFAPDISAEEGELLSDYAVLTR